MRKFVPVLLLAALFSCNPSKAYLCTHYHIIAGFDPGTGFLSASVQMVFVAKRHHADSLGFQLDSSLKVQTLAAQDLDRYVYLRSDTGRLVLYLEDPIAPGDQLHISLQYSGYLSRSDLDSSLLWIPANLDTKPFTMDAELALPDSWKVLRPEAVPVQGSKWLIRSADPVSSIGITVAREKPEHTR
jgi:hypothetical protein